MYGRQQQQSSTLGRPSNMQQQQQFMPRQNTPPGSIGSRQSNTPPSAMNNPQQQLIGQQGMMTRPSQRPPSPPLPPPPMGGGGGMPPNSQGQGYDGQQQSAYMQQMYSRQSSELSANPSFSSEKSGKLLVEISMWNLSEFLYAIRITTLIVKFSRYILDGHSIYGRQMSAASIASEAANAAIYARQASAMQQHQVKSWVLLSIEVK